MGCAYTFRQDPQKNPVANAIRRSFGRVSFGGRSGRSETGRSEASSTEGRAPTLLGLSPLKRINAKASDVFENLEPAMRPLWERGGRLPVVREVLGIGDEALSDYGIALVRLAELKLLQDHLDIHKDKRYKDLNEAEKKLLMQKHELRSTIETITDTKEEKLRELREAEATTSSIYEVIAQREAAISRLLNQVEQDASPRRKDLQVHELEVIHHALERQKTCTLLYQAKADALKVILDAFGDVGMEDTGPLAQAPAVQATVPGMPASFRPEARSSPASSVGMPTATAPQVGVSAAPSPHRFGELASPYAAAPARMTGPSLIPPASPAPAPATMSPRLGGLFSSDSPAPPVRQVPVPAASSVFPSGMPFPSAAAAAAERQVDPEEEARRIAEEALQESRRELLLRERMTSETDQLEHRRIQALATAMRLDAPAASPVKAAAVSAVVAPPSPGVMVRVAQFEGRLPGPTSPGGEGARPLFSGASSGTAGSLLLQRMAEHRSRQEAQDSSHQAAAAAAPAPAQNRDGWDSGSGSEELSANFAGSSEAPGPELVTSRAVQAPRGSQEGMQPRSFLDVGSSSQAGPTPPCPSPPMNEAPLREERKEFGNIRSAAAPLALQMQMGIPHLGPCLASPQNSPTGPRPPAPVHAPPYGAADEQYSGIGSSEEHLTPMEEEEEESGGYGGETVYSEHSQRSSDQGYHIPAARFDVDEF